ncbi:hypothetical protein B0J11DRAFT_502421 [Dendryphion nanum]|uniref:HTH APSES-type domain-containing protein n=1 Tax=Dendryphion nanum TaxID=256645 RepID=A0A9P9EDT4_9PLEO|nr:hypothetical protein B0J11DRAFT_502421 [Dendryphion nanum]
MNIRHLLNPDVGEDTHRYRSCDSPTPVIIPRSTAPCTSVSKRLKLPKDAAVFSDAAVVTSPVNYPPYEARDNQELLMQHQKYRLFPLGNIQKLGARRIPYNSEKKDFKDKTGRDAFEMFQYQFKLPGEEKEWVVSWDYQIGLVRMTGVFKCCKYNKTTPAKALNVNPGLRDICYSITGGSLAAQGYWMPYRAAKAVAATFAYHVRYVLTPVFGNDFPSMCLHPNDPNFAKFVIDPAIVLECTEETHRWKLYGVAAQSTGVVSSPVTSVPCTPHMRFSYPPPWGMRALKTPPTDQESGYGTDEDMGEKHPSSLEVSPRSTTWTSINQSQSPYLISELHSPQPYLTSVPSGLEDERFRKKCKISRDDGADADKEDSTPVAVPPPLPSPVEMATAEILVSMSTIPHRTKRFRRSSTF